MAGVKGRSGRRPEAQTGSVENVPVVATTPVAETPLEFMLRVMNDPTEKPATRARMAVAAAQYIHTKTGDGGKKDAKQSAAEEVVAKGKFSPAAPPRLVVNNKR